LPDCGHILTCIPPLTECNLAQIDHALVRIAQAATPLKRCICAALTAAAAADGRLQRREAELLRAFADAVGLSRPLD